MKHATLILNPDIRKQLDSVGFARMSAEHVVTNHVFDEAFLQLRRAAALLPPDHTDRASGRYRRYGRMIHLPWRGEDLPVPARTYAHTGEYGLEYSQPLALNSDGGGRRRVFAPVTPALYRNRALLELVARWREVLPLSSDQRSEAMQIGIHLIRMQAAPGQPARASPNLVHRDGEPFTIAVLLDRVNVEGGENVITGTQWHDHPIEDVPEREVLARFSLERPLDSYAVRDDLVAHFVAEVVCANGVGWRSILLLDYTPLRPAIELSGLVPDIAA